MKAKFKTIALTISFFGFFSLVAYSATIAHTEATNKGEDFEITVNGVTFEIYEAHDEPFGVWIEECYEEFYDLDELFERLEEVTQE